MEKPKGEIETSFVNQGKDIISHCNKNNKKLISRNKDEKLFKDLESDLMDIRDIISKQISFQPNVWSPIEKEIGIEEVIKDIKRGKYGAFLESSGHSFELTDELGYENYSTGNLLRTSSSRTCPRGPWGS